MYNLNVDGNEFSLYREGTIFYCEGNGEKDQYDSMTSFFVDALLMETPNATGYLTPIGRNMTLGGLNDMFTETFEDQSFGNMIFHTQLTEFLKVLGHTYDASPSEDSTEEEII